MILVVIAHQAGYTLVSFLTYYLPKRLVYHVIELQFVFYFHAKSARATDVSLNVKKNLTEQSNCVMYDQLGLARTECRLH